jgi:hypothetical protein
MIMKKSIYKVIVVATILAVTFSGCKKNVEKIDTTDFYGAWETQYSESETRIILCIENNSTYPLASADDAFVILSLTETDTVILFQGSYELTDGILYSSTSTGNYANEILEFSKRKFVMYSEGAPENQRTWSKIDTELLTTQP